MSLEMFSGAYKSLGIDRTVAEESIGTGRESIGVQTSGAQAPRTKKAQVSCLNFLKVPQRPSLRGSSAIGQPLEEYV